MYDMYIFLSFFVANFTLLFVKLKDNISTATTSFYALKFIGMNY